MTTVRVPRCHCGLYAIGECVQCDEPLCDVHGFRSDRFRCARHHDDHERQREEQQARRRQRRQAATEQRRQREAAEEAERKRRDELLDRLMHEGGLSATEASDLMEIAPVAEWVHEGVEPCDVADLWRRGIRKTETALRRSEELQEWRHEQRLAEEERIRREREARERERERAREIGDKAWKVRRHLLEVSVGRRSTEWVHLTPTLPRKGLVLTLCGINDRVVYSESASAACPVCAERRNDSYALAVLAEELEDRTASGRRADSEDYE